jgi:arginine exporter protein ArgO
MSLSTALFALLAELIVLMVLVVTSRSRKSRANRLVFVTGAFTVLSALWAFGLAGTDEALNQNNGSTWIALGLAVVNGIIFVTIHSARERMKYGSNPA